jgi:hypothetical protein
MIAGGAMMAIALTWTLWPAGTSSSSTSRTASHANELSSPPTTLGNSKSTDLNLAAFNAPLWVNPPQPVVAKAEPPPAPTPPWKAQLLAITRDAEGLLQAIFYDEAKDALVTVAERGIVVGRTVQRIDERGVTMEPNAQRIDLRRDPPRAALRASAAEDLAALLGRPVPRAKPAKEGTP